MRFKTVARNSVIHIELQSGRFGAETAVWEKRLSVFYALSATHPVSCKMGIGAFSVR
jgi:hypothetical protein